MTRVCLKSDHRIVGTIVFELANDDVMVEWADSGEQSRIRRNALEIASVQDAPPPPSPELQLLNILDSLRDTFNLAIECACRDIQRLMKKGGAK